MQYSTIFFTGKRYAVDNEEIIQYNKMVTEDLEIMQGPVSLLDFMPWLLKILPGFILNGVMKIDVMEKHLNEIDEHLKVLNYVSCNRKSN